MRRASLRRLVARVIAQADGRRLGHIGADERDGSRARFVVGSRANEAETEIKGGSKPSIHETARGSLKLENKVVSTYSLGYQSVSKLTEQCEQ